MCAETIALLLSAAGTLMCGAEDFLSNLSEAGLTANVIHYVTNVAQLRTLSGADYLDGCDFRLTGVVTLVDTNRDLVVLQDATGAVALNFRLENPQLQSGQLVTVDGTDCCPLVVSFPDFPYRPSGSDIQGSFETPMNWGEYNLTRMRGYLHPPVTGDYRFWIASDNSSELWLSTDADPSKVREIASVPRYQWVLPNEWSRFPSQRSELIHLEAGKTYYIEALQEQTTGDENLSAAWEGPGLDRSVISGRCLTPWSKDRRSPEAATNGVLREYWTNYSAGDLSEISGARPFESALTIKNVGIRIDGQGELPKPERIALNQPLRVEDNYRWVEAEGAVKFMATGENAANLELSDGQALMEVRAQHWNREMSRQLEQFSNAVVRVEGVCEGGYDQNGTMMAGLIWASAENSISFIEKPAANEVLAANSQPTPTAATITPARQGWYGMRGVVTFNDWALGTNQIFVQGDSTAVRVVLDPIDRFVESHLQVGEWVDIGGALDPGKKLPTVTPLVVTELGWHSMPSPIIRPLAVPDPAKLEGSWSELECVVRSVNTNGTLSVVGQDGPAYLWLAKTPSASLARYVDAKLRARGVLMPAMLDEPLLLVPFRDFLDVEEEAPKNPFGIPRRLIADLLSEGVEYSWSHRARVVGEVTYRDGQSFFIQDTSGGIRVRTANQPTVKVGDAVEVLAFPALNGLVHVLIESLVRPVKLVEPVSSRDLDLSEALSSKQGGDLIQVSATLLARKTNGVNQVLELQEQQRVFAATLAADQDTLPDMAPGSRVRVTGVCDDEPTVLSPVGEKLATPQPFPASLNILLRTPKDVAVLNGPPWWTWKRAATLVGALLTILMVTLLWVHLLHRRLERQQAARLAFSRQVLERLEDERRRIAANLHDSLGQILLAIKNQALLAMQRPPDEQALRQRLGEISGATSQAIEEVRQITHGLRPYQLDRLGLTQAIRALVTQTAKNNSILFASRVEDIDGQFDKDAEIHVYRIVQEAVTNVVKHSAATEATVVIKKRAAAVSLSIRDNGRGFDTTKLSSATRGFGYGLSGIAERVRILNGTLAIDSRPGGGASLTAEIPFPIPKT